MEISDFWFEILGVRNGERKSKAAKHHETATANSTAIRRSTALMEPNLRCEFSKFTRHRISGQELRSIGAAQPGSSAGLKAGGCGHACCGSRSNSKARANCNTPRSSKRWPAICKPIGK